MSPFTIIAFVFAHLALSAAVGYFLFSRFTMNQEQAQTWKWLGILFSFFMPGYGLVTILAIYFTLYFKRRRDDKSSVHGLVFDQHLRHDRISDLAETAIISNVNWREEKELQPLVDALKDEDVDLRKGAVDALAKKKDKEAIRILSNSLENTMLEVRYFAVEALAKIGKGFGDNIIEAQAEVEKNPNSIEAMVALANCYYEYATSEVEDKTLSDFYLQKAYEEYEKAFEKGARDPGMLLRYGEVLTRIERFTDALSVFKDIISGGSKKFSDQALVALADLYFKMGKLDKVKEIAARLKNDPRASDEVRLAAGCWT